MSLQWRMESFTTWSGEIHSSGLVRRPHAWQQTVLPSWGLAPCTFSKVVRLRAELGHIEGYYWLSWHVLSSVPDTEHSAVRDSWKSATVRRKSWALAADLVCRCEVFSCVFRCVEVLFEPLTLVSFGWRIEETCLTRKYRFSEPICDCSAHRKL